MHVRQCLLCLVDQLLPIGDGLGVVLSLLGGLVRLGLVLPAARTCLGGRVLGLGLMQRCVLCVCVGLRGFASKCVRGL